MSSHPNFSSRARGFTMVEIMIVVAIIGLLAVIAIPNFIKSRTNAQRQICIENLGQIESAKQVWGLQNNKVDGDAPTSGDLIGDDKYLKKTPSCPAAGIYNFRAIGVTATCTIAGHTL